MIDELTKQERENDFYNDYPKNFRIYGGINFTMFLLSISSLVEQITNERSFLEIILVNVTLLITTLLLAVVLMVTKRKEYTRKLKMFVLCLSICLFTTIICKCIFYIGFFDIFIHSLITGFALFTVILIIKYDIKKEYKLYFKE